MDSRAQTLFDGRSDESRLPSSTPSIHKEHELEPASVSTRSPSIHNADDSEKGTMTEEPDDGEYPVGFKLAAIVVALILSIFLVCEPFYIILPAMLTE